MTDPNSHFIPFTMNGDEQINALKESLFIPYPYTNATIPVPKPEDTQAAYTYEDVLQLMRPGNTTPRGSVSGFLDENQDLAGLIQTDTQTVRTHNTTHQALASLLWYSIAKTRADIITFSEKELRVGNGETQITGLTGKTIQVSYTVGQTQGSQYSPFYDEYAASIAISLTRSGSDETLELGGIQIPLIFKWGFYEGNVPGRIEPERIVNFFT